MAARVYTSLVLAALLLCSCWSIAILDVFVYFRFLSCIWAVFFSVDTKRLIKANTRSSTCMPPDCRLKNDPRSKHKCLFYPGLIINCVIALLVQLLRAGPAECFVIPLKAVWECTKSGKTQYWIQIVADRQEPIIPQGGAGVHIWQFPLWNCDEMLKRARNICNSINCCSPGREKWMWLLPQSTQSQLTACGEWICYVSRRIA